MKRYSNSDRKNVSWIYMISHWWMITPQNLGVAAVVDYSVVEELPSLHHPRQTERVCIVALFHISTMKVCKASLSEQSRLRLTSRTLTLLSIEDCSIFDCHDQQDIHISFGATCRLPAPGVRSTVCALKLKNLIESQGTDASTSFGIVFSPAVYRILERPLGDAEPRISSKQSSQSLQEVMYNTLPSQSTQDHLGNEPFFTDFPDMPSQIRIRGADVIGRTATISPTSGL